MSIQIIEIAQPSVIDTVAVAQPSTVDVVEVRQGPAGPAGTAGPSSVTSATTSDGTANLSLAAATVSGTLTASHIHGNLAGSVYAHVRAGEALLKGDPVYVSGSHGSGSTLIAIVSKADASNAAKMPAVGIMDANLAHNATGHMVITGTITELATNAYSINAELYVAAGGGMTATPPTARAQPVARVERSNANNGAIIVKVNELSASDATASTLVRRDASGGADFSGTVNMAIGVVSDLRFEDYQAAVGATFFYNGTSASDHRIALGAGTTGATLFGAATAGAARTTLGLGTGDDVGFRAVKVGTATTADATSDVLIATSATTQRGLTIQGKASQAGNLLRIVEHTNNAENNGWEFSASSVTLATSGTKIYFNASTLILSPSFLFGFSSSLTNPFAAKTLGFAATSAGSGVLEINNGTLGTLRDLTLRNLTASGTLAVTGATTLTGAVTTANFIAGAEMTAPAAPAANGYKIYAEDNGAGKTRLMVLFATGAAQQIAIEP